MLIINYLRSNNIKILKKVLSLFETLRKCPEKLIVRPEKLIVRPEKLIVRPEKLIVRPEKLIINFINH